MTRFPRSAVSPLSKLTFAVAGRACGKRCTGEIIGRGIACLEDVKLLVHRLEPAGSTGEAASSVAFCGMVGVGGVESGGVGGAPDFPEIESDLNPVRSLVEKPIVKK